MKPRELKFRAWYEGQMLSVVDLSTPLSTYEWLGKVDAHIMQFTGMKDKDGKELYEEDIIQGHHFKSIIEWDDKKGGWIMNAIGSPVKYSLTQERASEFEKIGNIYQNPKLLQS